MKIKLKFFMTFFTIVTLTVVLGIISYNNANETGAEFRSLIEHDLNVLQNAQHLQKLVIDAQTGQRGFIITNDNKFLQPYYSGVSQFEWLIKVEKNLVSNHPSQIQKLERIEELFSEWQTKVAIPEIEAKRVLSENPESLVVSLDLLTTETGKNILDQIRTEFKEFIQIQNDLKDEKFLAALETEADTRNYVVIIIIAISSSAAIIGFLLSHSISGPIKNLRDASNAIAEGNLDVTVKASTKDEIGELAQQFETMRREIKSRALTLNERRKELEKVNEELHLSEEKYRALYEESPDLYRTINTDGIIIDCNSQYAKRLGYSKKEIIGKSIFEHTPKNKILKMFESIETWKRTGMARNKEISLQTKNGEIFPCILSANNLYDNKGNLIGSNTIIKDISELRSVEKRAIEAEERVKNEKLTAIGELSSRIAHELRNPLNVVKTGMYLLKPQLESSNESNKERIEIINRAIDRMTFQLNDVMDYIRNKPLELQEVNLSKLIQSSIERANIQTKVEVKIPTKTTSVKADYDKLETVFSNLILNAAQAIKNTGKIEVRVLNGKMNNENVIIEVEDSGPGIPNENLDKIFDPLFTTKQSGSGLGLAACKNIIELHKGKITVQNNPTTFRIELPTQEN